MLLTADIGNTSTTIGLYDDESLVEVWRVASDKRRSSDEYGIILSNLLNHKSYKIDSAVLSSVVPKLTDTFKIAIEKYLDAKTFILNHKTCTSVVLDVESPSSVGADRIANVLAASKLYGTPSVVVDFGTATTFDIIVDKNRFIGGIIAPGVNISAEALSNFTSLLPRVKIEAPKSVIGKNTIDNMLSGVVRGHAAMIDGLIEDIENEIGQKVIKIATGGCSTIITDCLKKPFDHINPHLTLEGLRMAYELTKQTI